MKKPNLVACLVILLTFSAPALAAGAPGSTGAPGGGAPGVAASSAGAAAPSTESKDGGVRGREGAGPLTPEKLAAIKAGIIKHMDARIADLQQRKQCVQAATTGEALHTCIPNRPGRGGQKGGPENGEHQGQLQ